jgi:hypothetical protein
MPIRILPSLCLSIALGLLLVEAAMAGETVVVMGTNATSLTPDQVADVFLGRSNVLTPVDLPEGNSVREAFYRKATDRDVSQIKALWSRIIFTGQGQPPKELPDASAVKRAVAANAKLIGYIDKSDVDASVKVVLSLH